MYLATFMKVILKSEVWETLNVFSPLILQVNWGLVIKSFAQGHLLALEKSEPLPEDYAFYLEVVTHLYFETS